MWKIILISTCVLLGTLCSEAVSTSKRNMKKRGAGSYSGSYSNSNGATGGYTGNTNTNDYDDFGYAPDFGFGFLDPFAFHQQLTAQILAQQSAQQNAFHRQQAAFFDNIRRQNEYTYKGKKDNRYAPNYSAAAASIGPNGAHQTAFITPENPAVPNISNRFADVSPGGYKGVSVSSFSSSSDIDGKKTSHRGSQTTINDNGKITTYKVES